MYKGKDKNKRTTNKESDDVPKISGRRCPFCGSPDHLMKECKWYDPKYKEKQEKKKHTPEKKVLKAKGAETESDNDSDYSTSTSSSSSSSSSWSSASSSRASAKIARKEKGKHKYTSLRKLANEEKIKNDNTQESNVKDSH